MSYELRASNLDSAIGYQSNRILSGFPVAQKWAQRRGTRLQSDRVPDNKLATRRDLSRSPRNVPLLHRTRQVGLAEFVASAKNLGRIKPLDVLRLGELGVILSLSWLAEICWSAF